VERPFRLPRRRPCRRSSGNAGRKYRMAGETPAPRCAADRPTIILDNRSALLRGTGAFRLFNRFFRPLPNPSRLGRQRGDHQCQVVDWFAALTVARPVKTAVTTSSSGSRRDWRNTSRNRDSPNSSRPAMASVTPSLEIPSRYGGTHLNLARQRTPSLEQPDDRGRGFPTGPRCPPRATTWAGCGRNSHRSDGAWKSS